jgi:hypothetical protein
VVASGTNDLVASGRCGFDDRQPTLDVAANGRPLIGRKLDHRDPSTCQVFLVTDVPAHVTKTVKPADTASQMRSPFCIVDHPIVAAVTTLWIGKDAANPSGAF